MKTRFCLSQFTGVKDKNGRGIYENDIVQIVYPDHAPLGPGVIKFGNFSIGEDDWGVKHQSPCFAIEWCDRGGGGHSGFGDRDDLEVIGNIYETPELLKEAKRI